jgi:hypothetical protein
METNKEYFERRERTRQTMRERIGKLSLREITDLKSILKTVSHENRSIAEVPTKKREDAEWQLEVIDDYLADIANGKARIISEQPIFVETKPRIKTVPSEADTLIDLYIDAIKQLKKYKPTLKELESFTGKSVRMWSKNLNDPVFLLSLGKAVKMRQSPKYSKTEDSLKIWKDALEGVIERQEHCTHAKDPLNNRRNVQYNDARVQSPKLPARSTASPYDDLNDEMNADIAKETMEITGKTAHIRKTGDGKD